MEETTRYFRARGWAELLILAVPVFGAAAVIDRWGGSAFSRLWITGGLLIWAAAAGLLLGVVRPAERRIRSEPGPQWPAPGRLLWLASAGTDVLFVGALALMVAQPA